MRKILFIFGFFCMTSLLYAQQTENNVVDFFGANTTTSIDPDEILYWVGTGNTEVIFVGDWCSPDVALAWGVRFNGSSATVESVMDTIAAYDSRFSYSGGFSVINDVFYQDDVYNLTMSQPFTGYIMYNVNLFQFFCMHYFLHTSSFYYKVQYKIILIVNLQLYL